MKPTRNWETTKAPTNAPSVKLTAGKHIVEFLKVEEGKGYNDVPVLRAWFDIKEGSEFDGYFMNKFSNTKQFNSDAKYQGIYTQNLVDDEGNTNKYFKGFITAIEESNNGYKWDWNEKGLKGKKVGMVFRDTEWSMDGKTGFTAKPFYVVSIDTDVPVPTPKLLDNSTAFNKPVESIPASVEEEPDLPF